MPLWNTSQTYGWLSRALHWLMAAGLVAGGALGLAAARAPVDTPDAVTRAMRLFLLHKTLGLVLLALALVRLALLLWQRRPAPLERRPSRRLLAESVQMLLYLVMLALPLTGLTIHLSAPALAPLPVPLDAMLPDLSGHETLRTRATRAHTLLAIALSIAVALHLAGAWQGRTSGAVARMLSARRITGTGQRPVRTALGLAGLALCAALWASFLPVPPDEKRQVAQGGSWQVTDGTLQLTIRRFGTEVTGVFETWQAEITFENRPEPVPLGHVRVDVDIGSLQLGPVTAQAMGPDFFDRERFPDAVFDATILRAADGYVADGRLQLRGQTRPVTLPFALSLKQSGAEMLGRLELDRRDFGIGATLDDPGQLGFEVQIDVALRAIPVQPN